MSSAAAVDATMGQDVERPDPMLTDHHLFSVQVLLPLPMPVPVPVSVPPPVPARGKSGQQAGIMGKMHVLASLGMALCAGAAAAARLLGRRRRPKAGHSKNQAGTSHPTQITDLATLTKVGPAVCT